MVHNTRLHATLLAALATGATLLTDVMAHADAEDPHVRFQVSVTPTLPGGPHIVRVPATEVVTMPRDGIPPAAHRQLTSAVRAELDARPDGEMFEPQVVGYNQWKLVAKSEPRSANRALVQPFFEKLLACFHSLEPGTNTDALLLVLMGGAIIEPEVRRGQAMQAGEQMASNFRVDGCATARNAIPIVGDFRSAIHSAATGMLTEEFDRRYFGDSAMLDVAAVLEPLYFGPGGLWTQEKESELKEIIIAALRKHVLPEEAFDDRAGSHFRTFWDFLNWANSHLECTAPELCISPEFGEDVSLACYGEGAKAEVLFRELWLDPCLRTGDLGVVRLMVGGASYVLLFPES